MSRRAVRSLLSLLVSTSFDTTIAPLSQLLVKEGNGDILSTTTLGKNRKEDGKKTKEMEPRGKEVSPFFFFFLGPLSLNNGLLGVSCL